MLSHTEGICESVCLVIGLVQVLALDRCCLFKGFTSLLACDKLVHLV